MQIRNSYTQQCEKAPFQLTRLERNLKGVKQISASCYLHEFGFFLQCVVIHSKQPLTLQM